MAAARAVVAALQPIAPGIGFAIETGARVVFEPAFAKPDNGDLRPAAGDIDDMWLLGTPVVKLLAWPAAASADRLLREAVAGGGRRRRSHYSGGTGLLEISAAGVTKVSALADLCAARGITAARSWRSATCQTISRCSTGRARGSRSQTPTRRSSQPRRRVRPRTRTTASPSRLRPSCVVRSGTYPAVAVCPGNTPAAITVRSPASGW